MVAFVSLFVGLIAGSQTVQLLVGAPVAAVEVFLDGRSLGVLEGEPWGLACDFGEEVQPHELLAVARDGEGREIGRARQRLNLPAGHSRADVVLEGGTGGSGVVARLAWASVVAAEPAAVTATFDGQPLRVEDPRRIELPPHDPRKLHFFRAELDFPENVSAVVERAFGGTYADEISAELTALPVRLEERRRLPDPAELDGWFVGRGEPLRVVATEEGAADLVVVRDPAAQAAVERFRYQQRADLTRFPGLAVFEDPKESLRGLLPLGRGCRVRFLWPLTERREQRGALTYDLLLPPTEDFSSAGGGLYWLLLDKRPPAVRGRATRLADAVAVAGLLAAGRDRRRAVLLLADGRGEDASQISPASARRYLESLRVPFFAWAPDAADLLAERGWGPVETVGSLRALEDVYRDLDRALDGQRIVWLDGMHLPQDIALSALAEGIELAR